VSIIDFALGLSGMDDATISELDAALPGLGRLAAAAKDAEPFLTKAKPHIDAMVPHLTALQPIALQLWPKVQAAWPDIVAVTPTIKDLIAFANSKK
jgi:hypothetical protein